MLIGDHDRHEEIVNKSKNYIDAVIEIAFLPALSP
jgi:hypothetical protein